jgi:hypothetical protein
VLHERHEALYPAQRISRLRAPLAAWHRRLDKPLDTTRIATSTTAAALTIVGKNIGRD